MEGHYALNQRERLEHSLKLIRDQNSSLITENQALKKKIARLEAAVRNLQYDDS